MIYKHKLFTDNQGEAQVRITAVGAEGDLKFWREDGQLNFLKVMADDPDSALEEIAEGVYQEPKQV